MIHMKSIRYILCLGLSCTALLGWGQDLQLNPREGVFPPTSVLSDTDRAQVVATAEKLLNDYARAMTLIDETGGRVTPQSVNDFRALFNSNAQIDKDFEEYLRGEMVSPRTYADGIFNRLPGRGIQMQIRQVKIKRIEDDASGFWVVVLQLDKLRYNYVSSANRVKVDAGGKPIEQEMRIDVVKGKLDRAKIAKIIATEGGEPGTQRVVADYYRYFGPSLSLFSPSFTATTSDFWDSNHADALFEVEGQVGFSVGFDFLTNRINSRSSTGKNLFLSAGIHFYSYRINTRMEDFSISPGFADVANTAIGGDLAYLRLVGPVDVEESLNFNVIKIPLGVGYRLLRTQRSALLVNLKVLPTLVLGSSGDLSGTGTYDAELPAASWRLLEMGAANPNLFDQEIGYGPLEAGPGKVIDGTANPNPQGFGLGFQLSPLFYYDLSEDNSTWALLVGLDLTLQPGSFLQHDDATTDILTRPSDYETSILQHYASDLSFLGIGLRIGLQHRLRSEP